MCPAADRLGNQRQLGRDNLLRQSSLPADWLTVLQDSIDETIDLSSQFPSITSPDVSLSGATSEETGAGASGKSSIYSRDDSFLVSDTISGGLWSSPTSPGTINYSCCILFLTMYQLPYSSRITQ